ncbi:MAG: COX15/CtaA family protein [Candidatus Eiseniibacteriota bacterium]
MAVAQSLAGAPPAARSTRAVAWWLLAIALMIYVMVVIGGLTRLTESGLSIVEWRPFTGVIPPLNHADWQALFDEYQRYPEFQKINRGMTLAGFQAIFWLEFIHRLWGRLIGVVFLIPFVWFLARGRIDRALAPRLAVVFVLGGLQGALGWYMVKSGLVDRPDVSQYRLAAHLAFALALYGYLMWLVFSLFAAPRAPTGRVPDWLRPASVAVFVLVCCTIVAGAFVAGLDAGLIYNEFPFMGEGLAPPDLFALSPAWLNFFEHPPAVQFMHRVFAVTTFLSILALALATQSADIARRLRRASSLLLAVATVQVALGISTLLFFVPIPLAALHQATAVLVFTAAIWLLHEIRMARRGVPLA